MLLMLPALLLTGALPALQQAPPVETVGVARLRQDAEALAPLVTSDLAKRFLRATASLPAVKTRTLYRDAAKTAWYAQAAADRMPAAGRKTLSRVAVDEEFYYNTKYGSPLAYARPLELLGSAGLNDVRGRKILDFGCGGIGQLRLLASLGANVYGVDVDPMLPALYSAPGDRGRIGRDGHLTLLNGRFPAEEAVKKAVGGGCDLIISKNTLKNGYLHPARPVDKRLLVDLGVDDTTFVRALYATLKPGGRVLIYNLSPAPSPPDKPYKPWADGRCPFPAPMWEAAGFHVIAFDVNDDAAARTMAHALGWDRGEGAIDIQNDLFAHYTLVEKPR
jgi:SAM-dependent methyltransferase